MGGKQIKIFDSVLDRSIKPYHEAKDVILCRSGIMEYTYDEVMRFGIGEPPVKKDIYKVYRPSTSVMEGMSRMKNLPITREHPQDWVTPENWKRYAEGYTGSEVEAVPLGNGEIGIQSKLFFTTDDSYSYYLEGNREVSLGYQSENKWVENEEYDIIMTHIMDVNHLAITCAGRGGNRVSVIDSLIGGLKMFNTGLFHWFKVKSANKDSKKPFSSTVFDSIEGLKGKDEAAVKDALEKVLDSVSTLKDSKEKELLLGSIKDCFAAPDVAIQYKKDTSAFLDATFEKAEKLTLDAFQEEPKAKDTGVGANEKGEPKVKDEEPKQDDEEPKQDDEDGKGKGTTNISDSIEKLLNKALDKQKKDLEKMIDTRIKDSLGLTEDSKLEGGKVEDSTAIDFAFEIKDYL